MTLAETLVAEPPPLQVDEDGIVRVGGTRVTLDTVIGAYKDGATAEEIAEDYDALSLADVHAVLSYYMRHTAEVEAYLEAGQRQAEEIRRENEMRFPARGLRERLLARRNSGRRG
jgi:uncharacterized protein (DUF433 family)